VKPVGDTVTVALRGGVDDGDVEAVVTTGTIPSGVTTFAASSEVSSISSIRSLSSAISGMSPAEACGA
jgi:hypothetical protein